MGSQLLESDFTVMDQILVNREWRLEYSPLGGVHDSTLLVLLPSLTSTEDFSDVRAIATTSSGSEIVLEFDKAVVNGRGTIGLFFGGVTMEIVPIGTKVTFRRVTEENLGEDADYISQGRLDVSDAKKILARLESEGIRFQIDTDISAHPSGEHRHYDSRIALFVHVDDLPRWESISKDYFPE
jgi:hypothetical protein